MSKKLMISLSAVFALFVMCVVLVLVSCEKPIISDENESGATKGNLRVSIYQIEKTPFSSLTRAAASEACTRLNFAVYDQGGSRLKQLNQTSDMADFGHASFQLEEGTYQLVVVGHSANGNPTMTNPAKIQFTNSTGYTDTFQSLPMIPLYRWPAPSPSPSLQRPAPPSTTPRTAPGPPPAPPCTRSLSRSARRPSCGPPRWSRTSV